MRTFGPFFVHLYIWFCRIRHRRGYGVHSPWAFQFLTGVVYEKGHYYAYDSLALKAVRKKGDPPVKVLRLLLRLANYVQPRRTVVVGTGGGQAADYLRAGCRKAETCETGAQVEPPQGEAVDLLYAVGSEDLRSVFERYAPLTCSKSLFVFGGIHRDRGRVQAWREVCSDPRAGVTFDLYDVGLVFFDPSLNKQHYIVNF